MKKTLLSATALSLLMISSPLHADDDKAHWGYTGHEGPAHWGELSDKWKTCSTGKSQSPIDIHYGEAAAGHEITPHYKPSGVHVHNNGHTIQQNYDKGSTLETGGHSYNLLQFHFHSPSEHTVNGKHFPLEVHLVHADGDGNLAVVGVMFKEGHANDVVEKMWHVMPDQAGETKSSDDHISAADLLPHDMNFALYSGSLTTPPCSEGVRWHVVKQPLEVSSDQLMKFKHAIHDNNRPTLPLNGREVETVGH